MREPLTCKGSTHAPPRPRGGRPVWSNGATPLPALHSAQLARAEGFLVWCFETSAPQSYRERAKQQSEKCCSAFARVALADSLLKGAELGRFAWRPAAARCALAGPWVSLSAVGPRDGSGDRRSAASWPQLEVFFAPYDSPQSLRPLWSAGSNQTVGPFTARSKSPICS